MFKATQCVNAATAMILLTAVVYTQISLAEVLSITTRLEIGLTGAILTFVHLFGWLKSTRDSRSVATDSRPR